MSKYRPQKAKRNPWLPMKRQHYRRGCRTPRRPVQYTRAHRSLQEKLGGLRDAPFVLAVDTDRWFQRCPEQLLVGFKNAAGAFFVELGYAVRRPSYDDPFMWNGNRKADFYEQHTKAWRYCLNNEQDAQAFWNLLNCCSSYVGGLRDRRNSTDLYDLQIGETRELARWPIGDLTRYDEVRRECQQVEGYEILEVVCMPGERPRRPRALCGTDYRHRQADVVRAEQNVRQAISRAQHYADQTERLKELAPAISAAKDAIEQVKQGWAEQVIGRELCWWRMPELRETLAEAAYEFHDAASEFDRGPAKGVRKIAKILWAASKVPMIFESDNRLEGLWDRAFKLYSKIGRGLKKRRVRELRQAEQLGRQYRRLQDAADRQLKVRDHWYRQLRETQTKQLQLRLRRVCRHGTEEPAWYLNDATELDLPLPAVRRLAERLPDYWAGLYDYFQQEAGQVWPRPDYDEKISQAWVRPPDKPEKVPPGTRQYKKAELFGHRRELWQRDWRRPRYGPAWKRVLRDQEPLEGYAAERRQFRWSESLLEHYLQPDFVDEACRLEPQPGLFLCRWTDEVERGSADYRLRVALWGAGLLRWNPGWRVEEAEARFDLEVLGERRAARLVRLLRCLRAGLVGATSWRFACADPATKLLTSVDALLGWSIRGPPH